MISTTVATSSGPYTGFPSGGGILLSQNNWLSMHGLTQDLLTTICVPIAITFAPSQTDTVSRYLDLAFQNLSPLLKHENTSVQSVPLPIFFKKFDQGGFRSNPPTPTPSPHVRACSLNS